MKSYWIRVGSNPWTCVYEKKKKQRHETHTGRSCDNRAEVEWYVSMPRRAVDCLQPQELGRGKEISSLWAVMDSMALPTQFWTSVSQSVRVNCRCFKSGRLQWFVKAVLLVLVNDRVLLFLVVLYTSAPGQVFQPPLLWKRREEWSTVLQ